MASNSSRPYPYRSRVLPQATIYEFWAEDGLLRFISLAAYPFPLPPLRDYGVVLGLELQDPTARPAGQDGRIEATVVAVIEEVLAYFPPSIVVWICSPDKQQQRARNQLFSRWYQHYKENNGPLDIVKKDVETSPNEYASLLYRADHPDREALEELLLGDVDKL